MTSEVHANVPPTTHRVCYGYILGFWIIRIISEMKYIRIVTASGESYRNKTGIGQWENLLGDDFLRIHRSYLSK